MLNGSYNILMLHTLVEPGMQLQDVGTVKQRVRESMAAMIMSHITVKLEAPD
ncbi:hypothetical protein [Pontibacter chitinilyticus]|uniref:hypothetical protein n=1 Tax=Pontibacter chitinilyticus TaxID=2674989 RepID=UPI00321ABB80